MRQTQVIPVSRLTSGDVLVNEYDSSKPNHVTVSKVTKTMAGTHTRYSVVIKESVGNLLLAEGDLVTIVLGK